MPNRSVPPPSVAPVLSYPDVRAAAAWLSAAFGFERALARGARVLEPPTGREYGERDFTVGDLAGHRSQFAETFRDVAPEEHGNTTVVPWPDHGHA